MKLKVSELQQINSQQYASKLRHSNSNEYVPSASPLPTSEACSLLEWEPPAEGDALRLGDAAGLSALSDVPFSVGVLSGTCTGSKATN